MSGHTPGPWSVYEDEDEPTLVVQHEIGTSHHLPIIGRLFGVHPISEEERANARLIAAAPEMLEVLRLIADISVDAAITHMARAVTAKAEGKPS